MNLSVRGEGADETAFTASSAKLRPGVSGRTVGTVGQNRTNPDWPGWRGVRRDGHVQWLPETLPDEADFLWSVPLTSDGVGGIAVAGGLVVVGSRDFTDRNDVFHCFDADTGKERWIYLCPAPGRLDYGNSPRATPLFHDGRVFTFGAFGHLSCLDPDTGLPDWTRDIAADFGSPRLEWGLCGSPLVVHGRLIVQPGGANASLAALDPKTGETVWTSAGAAPGYSSLVAVCSGNPSEAAAQVVGFDAETLGGWDVRTGRRLWTVVPRQRGDFNVPTPVITRYGLVVSTENNGTRLHRFQDNGVPEADPVSHNEDLMPDSHSPVAVGGCLFGISDGLRCLDLTDGLKERWVADDDAFHSYGSLIASEDRLLFFSLDCELLLLEARPDRPVIVDRLKLVHDGTQSHAHPALVGTRLYVRLADRLACLELGR